MLSARKEGARRRRGAFPSLRTMRATLLFSCVLLLSGSASAQDNSTGSDYLYFHSARPYTVAAPNGRRLQAAIEFCPTTSFDAFLPSKQTPDARRLVLLSPYIRPYAQSCRTWKNLKLVYADEFRNVLTGERLTATFRYYGSVTESGLDTCYDWGRAGYVGIMMDSTTFFFTYLSTTMDKPYDNGGPPVPRGDVCLEDINDDTNTRTSRCGGSSLAWRLQRSYPVSVDFGSRLCCTYKYCDDLDNYTPYLSGAPQSSGPNGTSAAGSSSDGGGGSSNTAAILGAVLGVVGGLAVLVAGFFVYRHVRRSRESARAATQGTAGQAPVSFVAAHAAAPAGGGMAPGTETWPPSPYGSSVAVMQLGPLGTSVSAKGAVPDAVTTPGGTSEGGVSNAGGPGLESYSSQRARSNAAGLYGPGGLETLPEATPSAAATGAGMAVLPPGYPANAGPTAQGYLTSNPPPAK